MRKKKRLALFFTFGVSLKTWQEVGNLDREIKPYVKLTEFFEDIYFFTYDKKDYLNFKEILPGKIKVFANKWNLPTLVYSLFLPFLYRKQLKNIDVLKTNQMSGSWAAVLAKWLHGGRLVVRCGYELLDFLEKEKKPIWKRKLFWLVEKIAYKNADKIILTSEKDKEFVKNRFKVDPSKIEIIPNYIDTEFFKPLDTPKAENKIIFVGRLEKQKGLFNLLEAITGLPVKLKIIGNGSLRKKLERFVKEKKLNIEFKNNIPNKKLPEELNKSEIFILPSFYEGCPKVLLEAMSCGLACIGTNVGGIREIISHKENGYLCEPDVQSIKKAILEVSQDNNLKQKLGENARKTILEKFSLEKVLEKEKRIYESLR